MDEKKRRLDYAIAIIRDYCRDNRVDCAGCPLAEYICEINSVPPHEWDDIDWDEIE